MILIIGGAYQGKLDFAQNQYGITEEEIYTCTAGEIDFAKRCIYKIEAFTYCNRLPRRCHCSHHGTPVSGRKQNPL